MMAETDFRLRYPLSTVAIDYFYALLGLGFTVTPLALVTPLAAVTGTLAFFALLFFLFGLRTAIRHNTFVAVSDRGVTSGGLRGANINWRDLRELKLSYFSTRRDRQGGWMQLRLRGEKLTIRLDSTVEGFDKLVARAAKEARQNELDLAPGTVQNLIALGVDEAPDEVSPDANARAP